MASPDGVFRQEQRTVVRAQDGECPISDQFGETSSPPLFVGHRDDGHVRGISGQGIAQFADQFRAVVQTAVPGDDSA